MSNRFFKIDSGSRFITSITIGQAPRPGVEFVPQTSETANVGIGWSYVGGQFTDTTDAYKSHR